MKRMNDIEKVIKGLEICYCSPAKCEDCPYHDLPDEQSCNDTLCLNAIALLKEQDELLKHEYWRGYNNGRADERGLQEGTIMQTFSPD